MQHFLRIYFPIYLLLYLLVAFVIPSYRTYKKTGINPIAFGEKDNTHDYIGFIMKILIGLLFLAVLLYSFGDRFYFYASAITFLENYYLQIVGLVIIHVSLFWIMIAQFQMSTSWRIGIDEVNKTALKTAGIFGISRNPIFLGMMLSVVGVFFILPNALTFFLTFCTYFVIQIQIRLEEAFLEKQHGVSYLDYKKKVKRLI